MPMREIFRAANSVVVWLGEPQSPDDNFLRHIKAINSFIEGDEDGGSTSPQDLKMIEIHLTGVRDLVANAYFTRL
ncbi:uncharacterized protein Z520_01584 [Fonsecaea multimorphosa CBS 102226]|uniref:Uncharacterized protein n=1 Tax=Fonsecaea multimorphosa CBS 102226 TaxID=1442371 RepID=A0A0D2J160_9EURO|nr:uncharacterized protein Z520_01584 [Fonsecaea multimorphosa CBS 102226]KIY03117.1 hypothetical protein Z520_01584 [Fonsecaea multimorphosa CBS 102226]